jgi:hypothetical protein
LSSGFLRVTGRLRRAPLDVNQARGWTTIENGVAADWDPRLSVETRLNENVPAVVGVPASGFPSRWGR